VGVGVFLKWKSVLKQMTEVYATDLRNGAIQVTLQNFGYLSTNDLVIKQQAAHVC
jgi:hypothetical protein